MNRLSPMFLSNFQNGINIEIVIHALSFIRQPDMLRAAIHIRKNRDASNIQLAERPNNAHRDLPAISHQNLPKHCTPIVT